MFQEGWWQGRGAESGTSVVVQCQFMGTGFLWVHRLNEFIYYYLVLTTLTFRQYPRGFKILLQRDRPRAEGRPHCGALSGRGTAELTPLPTRAWPFASQSQR